MRLSDIFGIVGLFAVLFLAPGLPVALWLLRRGYITDVRSVSALAPLISIVSGYFVLIGLNLFGVRPPLQLIGLGLLAAGFEVFRRIGREFLKSNLKLVAGSLRAAVPSFVVGATIWGVSYRGYIFVAPNEDSYRHNLWISRISDVRSVLGSDVLGDSPLMRIGASGGKYPLAWHSFVGIWSDLLRSPIPILSFGSVFVLWAFVMPLGINVLAKRWAPDMVHLGLVAGVIAQLIPLVPGEPISWGAMTTPVGISLLPISASLVAFGVSERQLRHKLVAVGIIVGLVAIHTPEAATALVVMVAAGMVVFAQRGIRPILLGVAAFVVAGGMGIFVYRQTLSGGIDGLKVLWGATSPGIGWSIGSLATMTVNSVGTGLPLAILLVSGLVLAARGRVLAEALAVFAGLALVFYVSGAPDSVFGRFRVLTSPWYASYERTLWVMVPFAAIFAAVPIVLLANRKSALLHVRVTSLACALIVSLWFAYYQIQDTVKQVREAPREWSVVGESDRELFSRLSSRISKDSLIVTFGRDGGTYAYMFEGLPVTAGQSEDITGKPSSYLSLVYSNIDSLCDVASELMRPEAPNIAYFLFGTRVNPWGTVGRSLGEVESLPGLRVVDKGDFVIAAEPDFSSC